MIILLQKQQQQKSEMFYIQFNVSHDATSTAEGYNVTAAFYLAPYIAYTNLISCSNTQPVTPYTIDTSVFFQVINII